MYRKEKLLWTLQLRITIRVLLLGHLRFLRMRRRVGVRRESVLLSIVGILGFRGDIQGILEKKRILMKRSFKE